MEKLPRIFKVRQKADAPRLESVEGRVHQLLDEFGLAQEVRRGDRVGLTAGSRGIRDNPKILRTIIERLKDVGASPFVVPCMGSHGGGTPEGQVEVLESLGITEASVGAPIVSSSEVEEIGHTKFGSPVFINKPLCKADRVIVVNRIKLHTDFKGEIESGLVKMIAIGMGNHPGALTAHRLTIKHGFPAVLTEVASIILKKLPILFGVGIVENQYDETTFIDLLRPEELIEKEKVLLEKAKQLMLFLPFDQIDVLVVDEMGKDISGSGLDTNVIGRLSFIGSPKPKVPNITRIFVRDLSRGSHGNATGIGMADYTTKRLVDKIDYAATHINCITAMTPEDGRIPIFFDADREAMAAAFQTSGVLDAQDLRVLWIKNTAELEYLLASEAFLSEIRANSRLEIVGGPFDFPFDEKGNLIPVIGRP